MRHTISPDIYYSQLLKESQLLNREVLDIEFKSGKEADYMNVTIPWIK